jgi:RNA polymerase sigma-70 factor (ECF subfamily)
MGSRSGCETADDHELVLRTKAGDRSAFEVLVSRYQDRAYNVAYQILRHHEDALDVAQEAFARAYVSIARFRGKAGFYTWLYRILVNLAIDQVRARGRDNPVPLDDSKSGAAASQMASDPATFLQTRELREQIVSAVACLPPDQRAALTLREIDGLTYQEIARIMRCSIGTVMSRLYAARRKLQQALGHYGKAE